MNDLDFDDSNSSVTNPNENDADCDGIITSNDCDDNDGHCFLSI